jgi:hypothetical protein
MRKITRTAAIGASIVLLGALAIPASASAASNAAGSAVVLKGHIMTYGGKPIKGAVVEVIAHVDGKLFNKGTQTSSTGRYAITVKPGTVYKINFIGQSSDDHVMDPEFESKTGHVRVGSSDKRLDKSLHHDD